MRGIGRRLAAAGVIASGALLAPLTALAGSNGQEIEITSNYCYYAEIAGGDQGGFFKDTGIFAIPGYHTVLQGWWWKGNVSVDCYDQGGNYAGSVTTVVPMSQPNGDWWNVNIEPNYSSSSGQEANFLLGVARGNTGKGF